MNNPVTTLLNAVLASIHELVPIETGKPRLVDSPIVQTDHGVLIGIIGSLRGRLIIMGETQVFLKAGYAMYSMELPEEMVDSFVGEFGNSVAGHMATRLYNEGLLIDITPPTTMQGYVKLGGFSKAIQVPFRLNEGAIGQLVLAMEEN